MVTPMVTPCSHLHSKTYSQPRSHLHSQPHSHSHSTNAQLYDAEAKARYRSRQSHRRAHLHSHRHSHPGHTLIHPQSQLYDAKVIGTSSTLNHTLIHPLFKPSFTPSFTPLITPSCAPLYARRPHPVHSSTTQRPIVIYPFSTSFSPRSHPVFTLIPPRCIPYSQLTLFTAV